MSLSDEQMQELAELWLGKIAVVEIRELREKVSRMQKAALNTSARLLQDDNLRLRKELAAAEKERDRR